MFVADVVLAGHVADCSEFAVQQCQSFCLQSFCVHSSQIWQWSY